MGAAGSLPPFQHQNQFIFFITLAKFGHFSTRNWGISCFSSVIRLNNFAI
jgi:hypothetical protein